MMVVLLIAILGLSSAAVAQAKSAQDLMAGVYQQDTNRDATLRITMQVIRNGARQEKKFVLYRLGAPGDSKSLALFTDPPEMKGFVLFTNGKIGEGGQQWIYVPATQRMLRLNITNREESFAGSDFTYEDVADRVLANFTYRYMNEQDLIDGRKTYKVEAKSYNPGVSQYGFIYYWVAQDVPVILYAELYDQHGQLLRRYHASQLKHVSGLWGARRIEMSSARGDSRTVFIIDSARFNTGLSEALFTPDALDKLDVLLKRHPAK